MNRENETVAGHSILGETSFDAALREVYEEVGVKLEPSDAKIIATNLN